jgi:hypothetical protein
VNIKHQQKDTKYHHSSSLSLVPISKPTETHSPNQNHQTSIVAMSPNPLVFTLTNIITLFTLQALCVVLRPLQPHQLSSYPSRWKSNPASSSTTGLPHFPPIQPSAPSSHVQTTAPARISATTLPRHLLCSQIARSSETSCMVEILWAAFLIAMATASIRLPITQREYALLATCFSNNSGTLCTSTDTTIVAS